MEAAPGLVGVMECGVGQLQLVKVSGMDLVLFVFVEYSSILGYSFLWPSSLY